MESTSKSPQGYSDFFTSGLRAMTGRARRRTKAKSVDLNHHAQNRSSFWTDEYFELGHSNIPLSVRRRASVIIGGTVKERCVSPTRKRRSGLSSLPTRWFSRAKEPISSPSISPTAQDEDDALYADDEKEQGSLSIESPSLPSLHERSPLNPFYPIHPYSSGGSTPFEPADMSTSFKFERRRESFLSLNSSLNSSSSNISSFIFPAVPWGPPFAGARCPLSPLSPCTQSSSSWDHEEEEERERGLRGVQDEEIPMEASYPSEDQETCDWDAPAKIDWRQFHAHLLQIANDTTKL